MHHAGKGWEKRPYILYGQFINLDENRLVISPKTSVPVEYICEIKILAQPQVRDTVTCRLYNFSDASIRTDSVFLSGSMKRIGGNRFKAKVYANKQ